MIDPKALEEDLKNDGEVVVYMLQEWAELRSERTFFYYGEEDRHLTFSEFNRIANSVAHELSSMGVEKGDRVSLFLMNPLATTFAMFGIWKIGAVFCPINFNYRGHLLSYQINDTNPKVLIAEQSSVPLLNQIKDDIQGLPVVLYRPDESDHDYDSENAFVELDEKFQRSLFEDLLKGETSDPDVNIEYWDTANVIYTSGTTGPAKGVVQSHRWMHNYCYYYLKLLHPDDVVYNDLPLYHVAGAVANVARAAWGGCAVAVWDKFSPFEFWHRINACGGTSATLLDVMIPWLLLAEETAEDRRNTLKQVHMQPLPEYHHDVAKRFGIDFVSVGYGQTEAGTGFAGIIDEFGDEEGTPKEMYKGIPKEQARRMLRELGIPIVPGHSKIKKGFMGKPSLMYEATVLNEHDEELGPNQHGHLALRARLPYVLFDGYFNKLEATAEAFKNLWFHTGDGGYRVEDGNFYFVDRMGGFIRCRGENISSYQIEDILTGHLKVAVCAAFPIPAEEGEEDDIVVYIVLKAGEELSDNELRAWIKSEMPKFMWPKHIRFIDALPQTPTYKVEKHKLRKAFLAELEQECEH